ncbi:MAG: RdgB/HAM1 family non-canonical purine NTP pyrophosphatase [Bacteroidota bacterium]
MKIIFASQNQGKVKEVKAIFNNSPFKIVSLYDLDNNIDIEETGSTFKENALLKAKTVYDHYKHPTIADDSGLMIEQLDGRPGVISARYAGKNCTFEDNNLKVVKELSDLPEPHRAKFVSTAIFYDNGNIIESVGELHGVIIKVQRGKAGFGYDPIFIPDGYEQTISEMEFELKNKISHRAKSFEKLKELLVKKYC